MSNEEMVAMIQKGNNSLMLQLWENIYALVCKYANRFYTALEGRRGITIDDLKQTAYLALVDAVDSYKPGVAAFSTWYVIYLRKHFQEAAGLHGERKKNEPMDTATSLDTPLLDGEDITLADVVEDTEAACTLQSVEDRIWLDQLREVLGDMMMDMPEAYADTLYRRFWKDQTYSKAAEELGIAGQSVKLREYKGLQYLRQPKNRNKLRPFYDFNFYRGTGLGAYKQSGNSVQERYVIHKYG